MKITHIILIILAICFGANIFMAYRPVWQYDHLEQNASKVITGDELQAWATNLLARYPMETNLYPSQLGTNFPQQLRRLAPRLGPDIAIHVDDETNMQPFVQLTWGSGMLGASGFYVGSTNFVYCGWTDVTNYVRGEGFYMHVWQPGVWFFYDNE